MTRKSDPQRKEFLENALIRDLAPPNSKLAPQVPVITH